MFRQILRGAWYVIYSIITLPITITVIGLMALSVVCTVYAIRVHDPINKWLGHMFICALKGVKASIKWVKTGDRTGLFDSNEED